MIPRSTSFFATPSDGTCFLRAEGNGCATHHGKLIHRYDAAAREEPVNSTGIDGTRLAQVAQEIAPVDLAVALAPQGRKRLHVWAGGDRDIAQRGCAPSTGAGVPLQGEMFSDFVRMVTRRRARMGPVLVSAFSMGVIEMSHCSIYY